MIELNSVVVVFMVEALLVLLLLIIGYLFFFKKKNASEQAAINELIDKLEDTENIKTRQLSDLITEHCDIDADEVERLLAEIKHTEHVLYQQIIQVYLNRDAELLKGLDEHIDNMTEPFCKIINYAPTHKVDPKQLELAEQQVERAEQKIAGLSKERNRLVKQLAAAMTTMDEISAEYTRVFSGTQTELELQNSSKKMFDIFDSAIQRVSHAFDDDKTEIL